MMKKTHNNVIFPDVPVWNKHAQSVGNRLNKSGQSIAACIFTKASRTISPPEFVLKNAQQIPVR